MKSFQNQTCTALRRRQTNHRADHRSIAVSPKDSSRDPQAVKKFNRLRRRPPVKIKRHLPCNPCRVPVTRAVRNQYPELVLKRSNLPIKRIYAISPAAMEENQRPPLPKFSIVDRDRT